MVNIFPACNQPQYKYFTFLAFRPSLKIFALFWINVHAWPDYLIVFISYLEMGMRESDQ